MPRDTTCLRDDGSVQAAASRLVKACGGVRQAGDAAQCSKSLIHRYTDVHNAPPKAPASLRRRKPSMPVSVALDLERACGRPLMTAHMAAVQGYALMRPDWEALEITDYPVLAAGLAETAFEAVREANRALEDGIVEPHEAVAWRRQVRTLMQVCARLDVGLTTLIEGEGHE